MPTYKISQLTTATAVSATNQFEINQNGTSKSVEVSVIDAYIKSTSNLPVVVSVSSASNAVRITQTGTGNALLVEDSANPDATPFVIDASGNVGIGTASPDAALTVNTIASFGAGAAALPSIAAKGDLDTGMWFPAANTIAASTGGSERMRIDSSGNLLVGTTSQLNGSYGSKVNVQAGADNGIIVAGSAANWSALVVVNASNTLIGYLSATQSNISLVNVSDHRLKKNVTPLSGGLANINALKPVTYDWTNSDESGEGFLAYELQAVIPHAVTGEKNAVNDDGSIKPQGVDYSKIVVHLVAAIQELKAENDDLKARLTALEAK